MPKLPAFNFGSFYYGFAGIHIDVRPWFLLIVLVIHFGPPDRRLVSSGQPVQFLWSEVATSWACRQPAAALAVHRHAAFPSEPSFRVDQIPCLPWAQRLLIYVHGPSVPTLGVFGF